MLLPAHLGSLWGYLLAVLQREKALQVQIPWVKSQFLLESHPLDIASPYLCHLQILPALSLSTEASRCYWYRIA